MISKLLIMYLLYSVDVSLNNIILNVLPGSDILTIHIYFSIIFHMINAQEVKWIVLLVHFFKIKQINIGKKLSHGRVGDFEWTNNNKNTYKSKSSTYMHK